MSARAAGLMDRITRQIDEIARLFAGLAKSDLPKPHPEREGRTLGEAAAHIAEGYHYLARFLRGPGHGPGARSGEGIHGRGPAPTLPELCKRLAEARPEVRIVGDLTDEQLDNVPPPKSSRFSDGRRTLEQVIEEVIAHQAGHLAELERALASPVRAV